MVHGVWFRGLGSMFRVVKKLKEGYDVFFVAHLGASDIGVVVQPARLHDNLNPEP